MKEVNEASETVVALDNPGRFQGHRVVLHDHEGGMTRPNAPFYPNPRSPKSGRFQGRYELLSQSKSEVSEI